MSDIVERLRTWVMRQSSPDPYDLLAEAADEIERLRAEVSRLIEIELQFAPWTQS